MVSQWYFCFLWLFWWQQKSNQKQWEQTELMRFRINMVTTGTEDGTRILNQNGSVHQGGRKEEGVWFRIMSLSPGKKRVLPAAQGCLLWASGKDFAFPDTYRAEKDHFFGSGLSCEFYWTGAAILQLRGQSKHERVETKQHTVPVTTVSMRLNSGGSAPSGPIPTVQHCGNFWAILSRHEFVLWDNKGLFC